MCKVTFASHMMCALIFQLHRHHLNLPWPIKEPRLSQQPVKIDVNSAVFGFDTDTKSQFSLLASVDGCQADKLCSLVSLFAHSR